MEKHKLNKDELRKSLIDFDFSETEIEEILLKAEEADIEKSEDKKEEKKEEKEEATIDETAQETPEDEMKKSFDKIVSMKNELDKSMTDFLNKFGNMPGVAIPDSNLGKSLENDIEKAFGAKIEGFEKSFIERLDSQSKVNEEFLKSLTTINDTVKMIAESPNPLKGLFGSYGNSIISKGSDGDSGRAKLSLSRQKSQVQDEIQKSLNLITEEADKQIVRNMLSDYTISGKISQTGLDIVTKAINIDFEK